MRKRRWLAAGGSLLAATIGLFGAAHRGQRQHGLTGGRLHLRRRQHRHRQHHRRVRPARRRLGHPASRAPRSPRAARAWARAWPPRARSRPPRTAGTCWRSTPAATRSRSCASPRAACRCWPASRCPPAAIKPVSVAVSRSGLVYVANSGAGGSGYSGFRLELRRHADPDPRLDGHRPGWLAGLGDVFFNAIGDHLVGTRTGTSQIDSFVVLPGGRLLAAQGSPFTGQGLGQLGAEFSPASPSQLFVSNAHNGAGLGTVSAYRDGFLGQLTPIGSSPVRRRADRAVLGGDQPRRQVPVHRQHRVGEHLQLRHQPRRLAVPDRQHAHHAAAGLTSTPGCPRTASTCSVDGSGNHFRVRVRRQRRHPHRAAQLTDAAARRWRTRRDRQHLGTSSRRPWPARPGGPGTLAFVGSVAMAPA